MLNGLNSQLLKVMAEVNGIPLNPAVMGIGGALTTGAGIYKLMKDARRNNEEAIQEDTKFKEYQKFLPNAKLISYYTPYIKSLLKSPNPSVATVNLLAGLLSVQAKLLEHELTPVKKDKDIFEKKKDDRSVGGMLKDSFFKLNYKLNPFAQLFTYIFQGLTPSAIAKLYGFNDKKDEREQRTEAVERETKYGISPRYAQLLGMTGAQLLRNGGRDSLLMGVFEMSKMISETLLIIKLKGFGIGRNVKIGEADERSSFLGRMLQGILNIPGVNAVKNIIKTSAKVGTGIITSPLKVMAGAAELFDKTKEGFKNFMSGGLRKASQNEEYAAQRAGFVAKKFIDSPGFESTQTSIMKYTRQTAEYFKHYIDIFSKKFDIISNTSKIDKMQELHYEKYSGELKSKKDIANTYQEMYRRNLSGPMGTLMKLKAGVTSLLKSESPEKSLLRENMMMQHELAKATEEYKYSGMGGYVKGIFAGKKKRRQAKADAYQSIGKKMFKPSRDLAGEDDISEYMLGEGRQTKHLTGRQSLMGGLGIGGSSVSLLGGLAAALATVGTGGIGLLAPLLGLAGVAGSAGIGALTDTKFRKTGRGMFKSRMKREGESAFGKQDDKEINIASTKVVSEDILLMKDMVTNTSNLFDTTNKIFAAIEDIKKTSSDMYKGDRSIQTISNTLGYLYNLIDKTISTVKTELLTLKNKAIELVQDFKNSFITSNASSITSLPASGNIIDILKFYAADSYKKTERLTQVEEDELIELKKLSGFANSYSIAHAAASGGPATAKMKPESRIVPGKPPIDKSVDNVISINRNNIVNLCNLVK
jgi:hypothetical protein